MSKPTENDDTQPVVTYATFPRCECPSNCSCPCARNFRQLFHRMREWEQSTKNEVDNMRRELLEKINNLQRELEQERVRRCELEAQVRNMEGFRQEVQEEIARLEVIISTDKKTMEKMILVKNVKIFKQFDSLQNEFQEEITRLEATIAEEMKKLNEKVENMILETTAKMRTEAQELRNVSSTVE